MVDGLKAHVIGLIVYRNPLDKGKRWTEYRLSTRKGERWLSVDYEYDEFSISRMVKRVKNDIGPELHKVDEGTQIVCSMEGSVDVDRGEKARFIEYEDETKEKTLSVEIWSDGTEHSKGEYLDFDEIQVIGYKNPEIGELWVSFVTIALLVLMCIMPSVFSYFYVEKKKIIDFVKEDYSYIYVTSITGKQGQKADVYKYYSEETTDNVAKNIIYGVDGQVESTTQKDEKSDEEIAIVTKDEYCLVYHPEDDASSVYVQVSDRKYNYASDNSPYKGSYRTFRWYRGHYYSSAYKKDSSRYKRIPSSYSSYDGDTVSDIGTETYDSYSKSVRQSSINRRRSSSGGVSGGK